jgi:hypothetical protein
MVESFAPHVSSEEPLCDLSVTECCTALLLFALGLAGKEKPGLEQPPRHAFTFFRTYNSVVLQNRGPTVEHEDRLDSIEKEFAYSAQET